ncbi:MAG: hypothetical protein JXR76_17590 [Deltaproteobacteria bacterium]|nr:hypothetical protein [Deltaproteobacteria bacterium]
MLPRKEFNPNENKRGNSLRIFVACMLLTAVPVMAVNAGAGGNNEGEPRHKVLFQQGTENFNVENFELALQQFMEANRLKPNWKLLFNIGQCAAATKRYGIAYEAFEEYLAKGGDEVPNERRDWVMEELDRLYRMVGQLKFNVPERSVVEIDHIVRAVAPVPGNVKISAGLSHRVLVTLDGAVLIDKTLKISRGEEVAVAYRNNGTTGTNPVVGDVQDAGNVGETTESDDGNAQEADVRLNAVSRNDAASPVNRQKKLKILGWSALGAGAGMLISGSIVGGLALKLNSDLKKNCDGTACDEKYRHDVDKLERREVVSTVLLTAGAAAAAVGVGVWVYLRRHRESTQSSATVMPVVGIGSGGVVLSAQF